MLTKTFYQSVLPMCIENIADGNCIYTVADWNSMGRVVGQTRGRALQILDRTFRFSIKPSKARASV